MTTINAPRTIVMLLFWTAEIAVTAMILLVAFGRIVHERTQSSVMLFLCQRLMFDDRTVNRLAMAGLFLPLLFCGFILADSVLSQAFREISRESQVDVMRSCVLGAIPFMVIGLIPFVLGRRLLRRK